MSRRPGFLRESMWRLLDPSEKSGIHAAVVASDEASERLAKALEDVEMHRGLARKFADQARTLLDAMRDRPDSHGSPPSVVRRVEKLVDDLAATARAAEPREATPPSEPRGAVAYSPPSMPPMKFPTADEVDTDPDADDEELRVPTVPGSSRAGDPRRREVLESYDGEIEEL